tara:strand:- start:11650 stop:11784 length:135 start_codon:yes stop_codon:yes gene_type:complete
MAAKKKVDNKSACKMDCSGGCPGALYGLGFIGSAVYYIANASGF